MKMSGTPSDQACAIAPNAFSVPGPAWQQNTPTFSPEVMRLIQSAMCAPTRSCLTMIGRMPAAAHDSVSGFRGYASRYSTPSRLKISAAACATFIGDSWSIRIARLRGATG